MNTQEDDSLLYRSGGGRGKLLWFVGIGLFVAWNILIFILAVVAIAKVNNQSTPSGSRYTYAPISRPFTVGSDQTGLTYGGEVVSLQSNGRLRLGAGTSVWLSRGPKPNIPVSAVNIQATSFNPPIAGGLTDLAPSELVFMAFTLGSEVYGTLGVLSLDGMSLSTWSTPKLIPGLTTSEAVIALRNKATATNKKSFVLAGGGKLVVGIITSEQTSNLAFAVSPVQTYNGTDNTLLVRLSATEFVLAYATLITIPNPMHKMQATVANVTYTADGGFQSLALYGVYQYAANRPYHAAFPLVDATNPISNEFVIAYPSANAILINSTVPPEDTLVIIKGKWNAQTTELTFGPSNSLVGVRPNAFMTGVAMPTTVANPQPKGVLVFVNENENNAITALTVTKDYGTLAKLDGLSFGTTLLISDSAVDGTFQVSPQGKVIPFISVSAFDDQKLGVSYSNLADGAKITTTILELSPYTMALTRISAKFVISGANPNIQANYWWVKTAPLRFTSQLGYAVWAYLQTGTADGDIVLQSVVELAPPPLGIVPDNIGSVTAGAQVPVILSGVYKASGAAYLNNVGYHWYSDTLGTLHVRNVTLASIDYVISDKGVLLSLDSRVGLAISSTELLLAGSN